MDDQQEIVEIKERKPKGLRSWRGYVIEFALLFLAVFLGFLAENYREELSEQQQAKELAQNFYDELLSDSVAIQTIIGRRYQKDSALLDLKDYILLDSSLQKVSKAFASNFIRGIIMNARFSPKDVVLEQLKNSGSLVYFKSKEIQHLAGRLSVAISDLRTANAFEMEFNQTHIMPFIFSFNDQQFFDQLVQVGSGSPYQGLSLYNQGKLTATFKLSNINKFNREEVSNMLGIFRYAINGTTISMYRPYIEVNRKLLAELRKEYNIK